MKNFASLFAFIFVCFFSQDGFSLTFTGNLVLTTQSQVDAFNYDVVTGGLTIDGSGIVNINALLSLDTAGSINIQNTNITNVNGLNNLKVITGTGVPLHGFLYFSSNPLLSDLSGFTNTKFTGPDMNIDFIACNSLLNLNGIQDLDWSNASAGTKILGITNCSSITSLNGLVIPASFPDDGLINEVHITNNSNLVDVRALSGFTVSNLEINNNDKLATIDLSNTASLRQYLAVNILNNDKLKTIQFGANAAGQIYIYNNAILDSISGFNTFAAFFSPTFDFDFINISNNPNLSYTNIFNFSTSPIPNRVNNGLAILNNSKLTNLNFLSNIKTVGGNLSITNNALLSDCCGIYNLCIGGVTGTITISGNPSACSNKAEVLSNCGSRSNLVYGRVYSDVNSNNIPDAADVFLNNIKIQATKGANTLTHLSSDTGKYFFVNDTGSYIIQPLSSFTNFTTVPSSQVISRSTFGNKDTINFKLAPGALVNDASIVLTNSWRTRPGRNGTYYVSYTNESGQSYNGTIKVKLDSRLTYLSAVPSPSSIVGDTLYWNITNLSLFTTKSITINFQASALIVAGDTLRSNAAIGNGTADVTPANNQFNLSEIIRTPYDPNNKEIDKSILSPLEVSQAPYLYYTVHFQNVGNDTAQNVTIKDTLDSNLDWATFQPVAASHKYNLDETNGRYIIFDFKDINLPDSAVNESASHGFIIYKIKPKPPLTIGTSILNRASIVFDVNSPVATNSAKTVIMQTNAGADQTICAGQSATLTATGASTYTWSTLETTSSITVSPLVTTPYVLTGTVNGITQKDTVVIFVNPLPSLSLGADVSVCNGSSVTLTATTNAASVSWSSGQSGSSITVNPSSATTYIATGTLNGCTRKDTITVNVNPLPNLSLGADVSVCNGSSVTLTATTNAASVSWSSGQSGNSITVSPSSATTYIATGTLNGCTRKDTITVNVNPLPNLSLGADAAVCNGSSVTLTATTNASSVSWSSGQSGNSIAVSPSSATTYIATGTLNGCTRKDTITVNVNPLPNLSLGADVAVCNGSPVTLTATTNAASVSWSSGQSGNSITVSPSSATTYIATGTLNGCTRKDTITVNVNPLPTISLGNDISICSGNTITLTAVTNATSVIWNTGQTSFSIVVSPASSVSYRVTGTLNSCVRSDTVAITVGAVPTITLGNDLTICSGDSVVLTAATNASAVTWNTGASGTSISVKPLAATPYIATGGIGGCSTKDTIVVNVSSLPSLSLGSDISICSGSTATLTATTNAASVSWSTGQNGNTISVNPVSQTSYVASGTLNGCVRKDTILVGIKPLPSVNFTKILNGAVLQLDGPTGNDIYSWSFGDTQTSSLEDPVHTYTTGGMFYVTLTAGLNGCSAQKTDSVSVTLTRVNTISFIDKLEVSPNPAEDYITVSMQSKKSSPVKIELSGIDGKVIFSNDYKLTPTFSEKLYLTNLPAGIYFLCIKAEEEQAVYKIVKK